MDRACALAVAILTFVIHTASLLSAQEYEIRLSREYKAGDRYRFSARGSHTERIVALVDNRPVHQKTDEFSVELLSSIAALEVDGRGRVTQFALSIEKCLVTVGRETKPLFSSGTVILGATENNRTVLTIGNKPVEPAAAKILHAVIPSHITGVSDDDVFGTREKKSVGDTWGIQAGIAAKSLQESFNISAREADLKGAARLDGVVTGGDGEFLIISAWLDVDDFSLPLPDGVKIRKGQVKGIFSGRFPMKQDLQRHYQSLKTAGWFIASRPPDAKTPEMIFEGAIERNLTREFEPIN